MNAYARMLDEFGGIGDHYLIVDTETNGTQISEDLVLPTQLGWLLAVDRQVAECGAVIVNWAKVLPPQLRQAFWKRCRDTEYNMAQRGIACKVTADRIAAEGEDPRDVWPVYHELLTTSMAGGLKVVGHNIFKFDCPLLERVGLQMETPLSFPMGEILDFGLFEKAHSAGLLPPGGAKGRGEQWYKYARNQPGKGKWNLTPHCVAKYGLDVDESQAHGADYDCWIEFQLVEAYRAIAEETWQSSSREISISTS